MSFSFTSCSYSVLEESNHLHGNNKRYHQVKNKSVKSPPSKCSNEGGGGGGGGGVERVTNCGSHISTFPRISPIVRVTDHIPRIPESAPGVLQDCG